MSELEIAIAQARTALRTKRTLYQMEKASLKLRDSIMTALVRECLKETEGLRSQVKCPSCTFLTTKKIKSSRTLVTVFGKLTFESHVHVCENCNARHNALCEDLNIKPAQRISEGVSRAIRALNVNYTRTRALLSHIGIQVSHPTILRHKKKRA